MDANFIEEVADYFKCVLCKLVLKNPMYMVECAHRMCAQCLNNLRAHSNHNRAPLRCPCNGQVIDADKVFADEVLWRAVLDLKVRCNYVRVGCSWTGELRSLQGHMETQCMITLMKNIDERLLEKNEQIRTLEERLVNMEKEFKRREERIRQKCLEAEMIFVQRGSDIVKNTQDIVKMKRQLKEKDNCLLVFESQLLEQEEKNAQLRNEMSLINNQILPDVVNLDNSKDLYDSLYTKGTLMTTKSSALKDALDSLHENEEIRLVIKTAYPMVHNEEEEEDRNVDFQLGSDNDSTRTLGERFNGCVHLDEEDVCLLHLQRMLKSGERNAENVASSKAIAPLKLDLKKRAIGPST